MPASSRFPHVWVHVVSVLCATLLASSTAGAVRIINLANNDLVYDPGTARLYASTPAGTVVPIDPLTGALDPAIPVGPTDATLLARSSDGNRLWVAHDSARHISSLALPSLLPGDSLVVPDGSSAIDLAPLPDAPASLAILHGSSTRKITLFDGPVARPSAYVGIHVPAYLAAGPGGLLYAQEEGSQQDFLRFDISAAGLTLNSAHRDLIPSYQARALRAVGSLVAAQSGHIIDGDSLQLLATLSFSGPILPDLALQRIYQVSQHQSSTYRLRAYDSTRYTEVAMLEIPGITSTPGSLVRWGATGLAFRTASQVVVIDSPLVPSPGTADLRVTQLATPNPAFTGQALNFLVAVRNQGSAPATDVVLSDVLPDSATLLEAVSSQGTLDTTTPGQVIAALGELAPGAEVTLRLRVLRTTTGTIQNTATVSTSATDGDLANNTSSLSVRLSNPTLSSVRSLPLGARDVAYDPGSDRLLVTTGNTAPVWPNALLRIDPVTAAIHSVEFVGSDPSRVKLSSDGEFAFILLRGSRSIARIPVSVTAHPVLTFPLGLTSDASGEALSALDLMPIRDRPNAVAVARKTQGATHSVALYEHGVALPAVRTGSKFAALVDGVDPLRLYASSDDYLGIPNFSRLRMQPEGVALEGQTAGLTDTDGVTLKRAGQLIYTNTGRIIDPEALTLLGNLSRRGPVEPSLDDGRFYNLDPTGYTLRAYRIADRVLVSSLAVSDTANATQLVRCGGQALAFTTSTGNLYLLNAPAQVPLPALRVILPTQISEALGVAAGLGRIEIHRPATADLQVQLASSDPAILSVPVQVTLPAGQTSVLFDVTTHPIPGLNGTRLVTITPTTTSTAYTPKAAIVAVDDAETSALSLELPASATEGSPTTTATLRLVGTAVAPIRVGLTSSDLSELTVPAEVVIPAGSDVVNFPLSLPDDPMLDGPQSITITATVPGYSGASAGMTVEDNDPRTLTLTIPATAKENYAWVYGTLTLAAQPLAPVTVSLVSSDPGALTSPASITFAAGQTSLQVLFTAVDNSLQDGSRDVTVTASAPGFSDGTDTITIRDDELHTLVWSPIPSPQTAGVPFRPQLTPYAIDGQVATGFSGYIPISLPGGTLRGPTSLSLSNGANTTDITVLTAGPALRLRASASGLPAVESDPFAVSAAELGRFAIQPLSATADATPTPVTILAQDAFGNPIPDYTGTTDLSAGPPVINMPLPGGGSGIQATLPFNGQQSRTQSIYRVNEIRGGRDIGRGDMPAHAGAYTALSIACDVTNSATSGAVPIVTLRVKLSPLAAFDTAAWDNADWTTVHVGPVPEPVDGWLRFPFSQPFIYDGTSNLVVDFSYSAPAGYRQFRTFALSGTNRTLHHGGTGLGDPLAWSGASPAPTLSSQVPRLRLETIGLSAVTPSTTGAFAPYVDPTSGLTGSAWSGILQFASPSFFSWDYPWGYHLFATRSTALGISNAFPIALRAPILAPEPPVTGGTANTLDWTASPASTSATAQVAPDPSFTTGLRSQGSHTFTGLAEGPWYFRVQSTARAIYPPYLRQQTTQADFAPNTLAGTSADTLPFSITLGRDATTQTETFETPASGWSATLFSNVSGSALRLRIGNSQLPPPAISLPIHYGGDFEGALDGYAFQPAGLATLAADASIEAFLSAPGTSFANLRLYLRVSGTTGYSVLLSHNGSGASASAALQYHQFSLSSGTSLATVGIPSALDSSGNLRARFSIIGSTLALRLWRLSVSGGAIVETPVTFGNGAPVLAVTDTRFAQPGVAGLGGSRGNVADMAFFDDVTVSRLAGNYASSGTVTSPAFSPYPYHSWLGLRYTAHTTPGTSVSIDVLDAAGQVLAADLPSGARFAGLPAIGATTPLRLRARLATSDPAVTPVLESWALEFEPTSTDSVTSGWSSVATSIQDATAPTLAVTSATTSTTADYLLTGTATDLHGVTALTINGAPASPPDGFGTWSASFALHAGDNVFSLLAADTAAPANLRTLTFNVTYTPPDADADGLPDDWETAHGLDPESANGDDGPLGDPDHDGLVTLLEFATGLRPDQADPTAPVSCEIAPHPETGAPWLQVSYRRLRWPDAIIYALQSSTDLKTWSAPTTPPETLSVFSLPDGVTELVTVRFAPISTGAKVFVRLVIEAP